LTYFNKGLSSPYLVAFMFRDWADGLIANLKAGFAIYPKQQLANGASKEFSPGVYVFEISNGALKQERLNEVERGGTDPSDPSFINGPYQDFWVGGHDTDALGPYYIINPYDQANPIQFDAPVTNESYGLEIGFAPTSYKSQIPENLFSTHQYNISALVGDAFLLPLPWVNYTALSPDIKAMEDKITWKPFPVAGGNAADQASIEASYDNGTIAERSVIWETEEPGFFFIRTKSTYNILNRYGTLKMPPVTPAHGGQIKDATFNKAEIRRLNNYPPTINARPIVDGSVDIKITKLNGCAEARAAAEAIAAAKDQASAEGFTPPA
jgi:hypothetical protein